MSRNDHRRAAALVLMGGGFVGTRLGLPFWVGLLLVLAGAGLYVSTVRLVP